MWCRLEAIYVCTHAEGLRSESANIAADVNIQAARVTEERGSEDLRRVPLRLEAIESGAVVLVAPKSVTFLLWGAFWADEHVRWSRPRWHDAHNWKQTVSSRTICEFALDGEDEEQAHASTPSSAGNDRGVHTDTVVWGHSARRFAR
eukprot:6999260-Prymnesium_polylepis.1